MSSEMFFKGLITVFVAAVALFVFIMLSTGCAVNGNTEMQQKYSSVEGCDDSILLKSVTHPDQVKALIFVANAMVINKGLYSALQVTDTLDKIEALVKPGTTYLQFVTAITPIADKLNGSAGYVLLAISPIFSQLQFDIPINECDRTILINLIGEIRDYVKALAPADVAA